VQPRISALITELEQIQFPLGHDPDAIVNCGSNALLAAEVTFGRLQPLGGSGKVADQPIAGAISGTAYSLS